MFISIDICQSIMNDLYVRWLDNWNWNCPIFVTQKEEFLMPDFFNFQAGIALPPLKLLWNFTQVALKSINLNAQAAWWSSSIWGKTKMCFINNCLALKQVYWVFWPANSCWWVIFTLYHFCFFSNICEGKRWKIRYLC